MADDWVYRPPRSPHLDVRYRDSDLIVVAKPPGLLSVPGRGEHLRDSVYTRILERFPYARVSHRLDLDTSGVLAFGLHKRAERHLDRQFQERAVGKVYLARVVGELSDDEGVIDRPLARGRGRAWVDDEAGRPAVTRFSVLQRGPEGTTLLALRPETGRSHQLRVHLQSIGHPILGDRFYAPTDAQDHRMWLHAWRLTLVHPSSEAEHTFVAPPPAALDPGEGAAQRGASSHSSTRS